MLLASTEDACVLASLGFGAFFLYAFVTIWWQWGTVLIGKRRFKTLPIMLDEMARLLGMPRPTFDSKEGLSGLLFRGPLPSGRVGAVKFFDVPVNADRTIHFVYLVVQVDDPIELRIKREGMLHKIGKVFGATTEIQVGDPAFDKAFLIETKDERVPKLLEREAVTKLFELPVMTLSFTEKTLSVDFEVERLQPEDYPRVLALLDEIAKPFDAKKA